MRFELRFSMDNAAFVDDVPSVEAARILRAAADRAEYHPNFSPGHSQPVFDVNGNEVGSWAVKES